MKTLLYNPIFINPQAYYVFPRLTRYLQPDNESTSEPANYIGTIEVKVIAYGDTTLKRTYTNTDSIDLSEFKNTWINVSLFTKVGSCVLGEWKIGNVESDLPYIDPEVLASLKAVVIVGNKTNNDSDRAIVKNLVDPDNPFVISNAAFKLNSGFGGFVEDFTSWDRIDSSTAEISNDGSKIKCINTTLNVQYLFNYINRDISSFKVKISNFTKGDITYYYRKEDGIEAFFKITPLSVVNSDKVIELPKSYNTVEGGTGSRGGFYSSNINIGVTIEQIPSFQGAFVTDGINDLIASTKTVQEMGITDEVTVVSMIHQIDNNANNFITTNNLRNESRVIGRNVVANIGKTGIYGWYKKDIQGTTATLIDNILGDKNDYTGHYIESTNSVANSKFYVTGYAVENGFTELSSVAWYWTIIANKVLTTDEINQVIAYFNLDRTLKPDILCNTIKQGITNENHAEFGDKLIDFSGNGRDIQLNNLAWKGNSGIGKYAADFTSWTTPKEVQKTSDTVKITTEYTEHWVAYLAPNNTFKSMKVLISGIPDGGALQFFRTAADGGGIKMVNGINEIPEFTNTVAAGFYIDVPLGFDWSNLVIEQIPSHAGALCLDGVNDFGKVTGMPIYKDYTFIIDREIISIGNTAGIVASKSEDSTDVNKQGAFLFEYLDAPNNISAWSFYKNNGKVANTDFTRGISYQSKYSYNGIELLDGTALDSDKLWLGILRDKDSRFANVAIYSLMSFPYSMSEFLIERQLKKHKLGTLYPDMVEFRPVIKHDDRITAIKYYHIKGSSRINLKPGDYIPVGSKISITTNLKSPYTIANVMSSSLTDIKVVPSAGGGNAYDILGYVTDKSPQKITMDIQVDSSLVQWNPVVESNVPYKSIRYYKLGDSGSGWMRINIGDYITIGRTIMITIDTVNTVDELVSAVSSQLTGIDINGSNGTYNITGTLTSESPQNINITIDEYIRYEDIVQPYPSFVKLENLDRTYTYTWGDKLKVGDTIRYNSSKNLLEGAYTLRGELECNGVYVFDNNQQIVVTKEMVFAWTHSPIWNIDDNEPKVILSPSRLRIPNSSYKILGYIPDISGHGNHGKINNSAYKLNSGVNGYLVDFTTLKDDGIKGIVRTDSKIYLDKSFNYNQGFWLGSTNNPSPAYKVKVSGIPETGMLTYTGGVWLNLVNGINELPARTNTEEEHGFVIQSPNLDWSNLVIEQIGEYEGAYCLDGVDDFVTIPTLSSGGKQVLMKVNSRKSDCYLYDQRNNWTQYLGIVSTKDFIAYNYSNQRGKTYIDGILNENITANDLIGITHNITVTNNRDDVKQYSPCIGTSFARNSYAQMALYDFMLFDNISTDDKIKELNEYVGIEGNTEWRKTE